MTFKADVDFTIIFAAFEHNYCLFCIVLNCNLLLIQQNVDESHFFNRSWAEFKVRFNDSGGNYWLGNDLFHKLTTSGRYELRFDLQALDNGDWYYAMYTMRQPIT